MRLVLYDDDTFEPITIVEIPHWNRLGLEPGDAISVPVYAPPALSPFCEHPGLMDPGRLLVRIAFERVGRNGRGYWLAVTRDPETALLCRAAFLPGQRRELHQRERQAFARGILAAFEQLGGQHP